MNRNVVLTGEKQIDSRLAALPANLQKKGVRKATRAVAKEVLEIASRLVPVGFGDLQDSLAVRVTKAKDRKRNEMGHSVLTRDGMFSGEQFYGGFIEFGWDHVYAGPIEEDSYLREALYQAESHKFQTFQSHLRSWLASLPREAA